jgi:hypothetical protein
MRPIGTGVSKILSTRQARLDGIEFVGLDVEQVDLGIERLVQRRIRRSGSAAPQSN